MIFDTSRLTDLQRTYFDRVLASYDYDWDSMLPMLKKRSAYYGKQRTSIPVIVSDQVGAAAWSWPDGRGMFIDDQVAPDAVGPGSWLWFMQIVMHELGHQVDFFGFTDRQRKRRNRLLGSYWSQGCPFSSPFARAFSTYRVGETEPDDSIILRLRGLMGGTGPIPAKQEMVA